MKTFFTPEFTHRESCLANHVRCAAWAVEALGRKKALPARQYAMWARDWWARFLRCDQPTELAPARDLHGEQIGREEMSKGIHRVT